MGSDDSISGTRVAPSGIVLDPSIPIHPGPEGFGSGASVSFAAGAFAVLVAGPGGPDDDDVHRVRVDPAGAVVGTSRIGSALSSQTDPVMAVGAGVTFVAWIDNRGTGDLYGARVDRGAAPAVSFDGTNFLVVHRFGPFREHELRGVRVR